MKKISSLAIAGAIVVSLAYPAAGASRCLNVFDKEVFHDGYNGTVFDTDLNDGVYRIANYLHSVRLTEEQLDWFGTNLRMEVLIDALCDDFDRIGNINIAFVEKGAESYDIDTTPRIEIGRFITPFMNKNVSPTQVPYQWDADRVALIMRDASLRERYDFWVEFEVFGIPYDAHQKVAGCAGRTDVFAGTLNFYSDTEAAAPLAGHCLMPVVIKRPEFKGHNLNNYSEAGTDEIGKCIKTWTFEASEDLNDAELTLIISNHGSNGDGEEYNRRKHWVYVDDKLKLIFTPGGKSCEEFREYNTMPNGIYGLSPKTESNWTSWNNWCPGDKIPTRSISLGALSAGTHKVKIKVPEATFAGGQGDFPVSIYVQGMKEGTLEEAGISTVENDSPALEVTVKGDRLEVNTSAQVYEIEVCDIDGTIFYQSKMSDKNVDMADWPRGIYIAIVSTPAGELSYTKFRR